MPSKTSSPASSKTHKAVKAPKKSSAKPGRTGAKSAKMSSSPPVKTERVMTIDERLADMRAHGEQMRKSKASALAFLKRAGIVDDSDQLARPFRN